MKIGDHPVDLMVDTGAEHSIVTQPVGLLSKKHTTVIGATSTHSYCSDDAISGVMK
jgi:hypothetical protein